MKPKKLLSFILAAAMAIFLLPAITPNVLAGGTALVQTREGNVYGTLTEMIEYAQKNGYSNVYMHTGWSGDITLESGAISIYLSTFEFEGNITVNEGAVLEIYDGSINDEKKENAVITNNGTLFTGNCSVWSPVVNNGNLEMKAYSNIYNRLSINGGGKLNCQDDTCEIKQLYVKKTNDGTPEINLNANAPRINYIKSESDSTTLAPLTLSELLEDGYTFKYKGEWVDGTLTELGDENGTEYITVEITPTEKAAFITNDEKPTANSRTYDGTEQNLVNAGTTSEGKVKYALSKNGQYSETVPTGKNAGDYTVWYYIAGDSTHFNSDKESVDVKIEPKSIAGANIELGADLIYDGTIKKQTVSSVTIDGLTLKEDTDYTISDNTGTEAGDNYKLTLTGKGNFTGTETKTFAIKKANSQTTATADTTVTYGNKLKLTANVEKTNARTLDKVDFYVGTGGAAELLGTADVTYTDGTLGTATLEVDTTEKKLEIGKNKITADYGGSVNLNNSKSDVITVELEQKTVVLKWINCDNLIYDGQPKNVGATATGVESGDGEIGVRVVCGDETNAGTYTAMADKLTGTNAKYYKLPNTYDGITTVYTILPKPVTATISDIADHTYTESAITPQITAYDGTTEIPKAEYTVSYSDNVNAGKAIVTLTDNTEGNYIVSGSGEFKILPKNINGATIGTFNKMTYNGKEQTPKATVTVDGLTATGTWSNVINVGDTTTFTADGNFTGAILDVTPNMAKKSIENAALAIDGELTYSGGEQTQNVTLTLDGFTNVTFNVSGNKQTNVKTDGDYTLTVTANGNFEGEKTLDWNIKPYTPKESKKTTARLRKGKTLAEAEVIKGEMLGVDGIVAVEGAFAWADDTKIMSTGGTEQMTFTPNDTNYAPIVIDVDVSTYSSHLGGGGSSTPATYTVMFEVNGGSKLSGAVVTKNNAVEKPTVPEKDGYIFDGWYADKQLTTEYDFNTKVNKNITLYAKWVEDEAKAPNDDKKDDEQTKSEPKNLFGDVLENDWFFDSVKYVNENGLMSGTTSTTFSPNESLTRAMLVTVIYRAEGEPAVNESIPFADVTVDNYYANAVIWAQQNGIVSGINESSFAPDENITREQIAVILYRYANYKGYDVSVGENTNILSYTDFDKISEYAIEAMQYAVGSGLMKGKTENTLNPKDFVTRAEIAAMLQRFIEGNK